MTPSIITPDIGAQIVEALGLPKETTNINIHFSPDSLVRVTCEILPDKEGLRRIFEILAK